MIDLESSTASHQEIAVLLKRVYLLPLQERINRENQEGRLKQFPFLSMSVIVLSIIMCCSIDHSSYQSNIVLIFGK